MPWTSRVWRWLDGWQAERHGPGRAEAAGVRPDPQQPAGTDLLPKIKHIVVLMMENHSYDNYFGMLDRGDGLPRDERGLPSPTNAAADGTIIPMQRFTGTVQRD